MKHSALHALVIGFLWASFCHLLALTVSGLGLGQLIQMPAWPVFLLGGTLGLAALSSLPYKAMGIFLIAGFAGLGLSKSPSMPFNWLCISDWASIGSDTRHDGVSTIAIDWSFCGYAG